MKIGIIDSGAGGLTILNAIQKAQPHFHFVYLADDKFAPYGDKTIDQLRDRLVDIGAFFEKEKVSAIIVACNTATVVAIDILRASISIPVIGVEPAVKPAFHVSKSRNVAVLATPITAKSARLKQLISLWKADNQVLIMSSDTLAFDIDAWPETQEKIKLTVTKLANEMLNKQVDTLVLACTHYPLVKHLFKEALGDHCQIIEPSEGVTSQLMRRLLEHYSEDLVDPVNIEFTGKIELCKTSQIDNMQKLQHWLKKPETIVSQRVVSIKNPIKKT